MPCVAAPPDKAAAKIGIWSAAGRSPFDPIVEVRARSPDHRVAVISTEKGTRVIGRQITPLALSQANPFLIEIVWSPDSRSFALNWSDGGAVGGWHASVYSLDRDDYVVSHDVEGLVEPLARSFPICEATQSPNIGVAGWINDGKELLVVAEAPPHSVCANMGAVVGFRVSTVTWNVLERIPGERLVREWHAVIGDEVRSSHMEPACRDSKGLLVPHARC
jgi:hypothetical protein